MRDHNYITPEGRRMPVAEMPTSKIQELLADGEVQIDDSDGYRDPSASVMERLRIELLIRELGLR